MVAGLLLKLHACKSYFDSYCSLTGSCTSCQSTWWSRRKCCGWRTRDTKFPIPDFECITSRAVYSCSNQLHHSLVSWYMRCWYWWSWQSACMKMLLMTFSMSYGRLMSLVNMTRRTLWPTAARSGGVASLHRFVRARRSVFKKQTHYKCHEVRIYPTPDRNIIPKSLWRFQSICRAYQSKTQILSWTRSSWIMFMLLYRWCSHARSFQVQSRIRIIQERAHFGQIVSQQISPLPDYSQRPNDQMLLKFVPVMIHCRQSHE